MTRRAEPFRLASFEAEARAVVEKAKAVGAEILRRAQKDASVLGEKARQQAVQQGLQQGRQQAMEAERKRIAEETAGLRDLLKNIAEGIEGKRTALASEAERDLVRLAIAVAERIVKKEVKADKSVAARSLRQAVALCACRRSLDVRANPDDVKMIEKYLPELRREFAEIADISVTADESVDRGGCVVVTRAGEVDAKLKTQLDEIERQLLA